MIRIHLLRDAYVSKDPIAFSGITDEKAVSKQCEVQCHQWNLPGEPLKVTMEITRPASFEVMVVAAHNARTALTFSELTGVEAMGSTAKSLPPNDVSLANKELDRELHSMTRWAYYGIADGFMHSLLSRWEHRSR